MYKCLLSLYYVVEFVYNLSICYYFITVIFDKQSSFIVISPVSRNWPMRDRKVIGHKVYVVIGKWMPMCKSLCVVT